MPSKKILIILIICFGVVTSIYLLSKNTETPFSIKNTNISTNPYINIKENTNNDWQKILVNIDSNNSTTTILTEGDPNAFDETTLTAQMSRDMFSRYLLIAKKDGGPTTEDTDKIASDLLATPEYLNVKGAVYISSNLKIVDKTDKGTVMKYNDALYKMSQNRTFTIQDDPLTIVNTALETDNEKELLKLDPYILASKGSVNDLLEVEVPKDAVVVHLALLNAYSNLLSTIESLRATLVDPVKGIAGLTQFQQNILDLEKAQSNLNIYFEKKLGKLQ